MFSEFPSHITWLINEYWQTLHNKLLLEERGNIQVEQAFSTLVEADPTDKKLMVDWLVKSYLKDGYRWEDIEEGNQSKVYDILVSFGTWRYKLVGKARDINQYTALGSVYAAIKHFLPENLEPTTTGKNIKKKEREYALAESKIVYRDQEMIVAIPLSQQAAQWWGQGTKWCTAADKNNYFSYYNKEGPLIIIILNGKKLQLFATQSSLQFMDENDAVLDIDYIMQNWQYLSGIISWAWEQNRSALGLFPLDLRSKENCIISVKENWRAIRFVPTYVLSEEICLLAINQNCDALQYIPKEFLSEELYKQALMCNHLALLNIPSKLRTDEFCKIALEQKIKSLDEESSSQQHFINYFLFSANTDFCVALEETKDIQEIYIEIAKHYNWILEWVPSEHRTENFYRSVIERSGGALCYVPQEYKSLELCAKAVAQDGAALQWVPSHLKTQDICKIAVAQTGAALTYVPRRMRSLELCTRAIKEDGRLLSYVPEDLRSWEMCWQAIENSADVLQWVPTHLLNENICLHAVKQGADAILWIPERLLSKNICMQAIQHDIKALDWVPLEFRDSLLAEMKYNNNLMARSQNNTEQCNEIYRTNWSIDLVTNMVLQHIKNPFLG